MITMTCRSNEDRARAAICGLNAHLSHTPKQRIRPSSRKPSSSYQGKANLLCEIMSYR